MAEENQFERTEPATQRRLDQAREQGTVARSVELTTFAMLATATGALAWLGSGVATGLAHMMSSALTLEREAAFDTALMLNRLGETSAAALIELAPIFLVLSLAAAGAPLLLSGWNFSLTAVSPNFARLSPVSGLGRIFSIQGLVELFKALAKASILGGLATAAMWGAREQLLGLGALGLEGALGVLFHVTTGCLLAVVGGMLLIAACDVAYQLWHHQRGLRMSREELKREVREEQGDPQIKGRIRQQQREMARRRMMSEVPRADVVVTNPAHFAVALSYQETAMRAPTVLAKGADLVAQRIREIAIDSGVPLLAAPPLARALYRHGEIGIEIPAALYGAVAEVLAYVYQLRRTRGAGAEAPQPPAAISVPPELDFVPHAS